MARNSRASRVTGTFADLTGRSDDEVRLALTLAVVAAGALAAARLLKYLVNLDFDVLRRG
jgi:hypothetical protein